MAESSEETELGEMMAEKTVFADPKVPIPESGTVCCYNCRFANHAIFASQGTPSSNHRIVECRHSPPSVVILPAGLDQTTGQVRVAIQSKFPVMSYADFCHRFERDNDSGKG